MEEFGRELDRANLKWRIKPDVELVALNAKCLRSQKVSKLVDKDDEAQAECHEHHVVEEGSPSLERTRFCGKNRLKPLQHGKHGIAGDQKVSHESVYPTLNFEPTPAIQFQELAKRRRR